MKRLDAIVSRCITREINDSELNVLPSGERAYVAIASGSYELVHDPLEAWFALDYDLQVAVCKQRGWPLGRCEQDAFTIWMQPLFHNDD